MTYETDIMLTPNMVADFTIDYHVTDKIPGDLYQPSSGQEVQIDDIILDGVRGVNYAKSCADLEKQGWLDAIENEIWSRIPIELENGLDDQLFDYWKSNQ